jgi:hypothetical protein
MIWSLAITVALPLYFLQVFLHEASHAIIPWLRKHKVSMWLLPNFHLNRLTFGYVRWEATEDSVPLTQRDRRLLVVLPRLVQIALIVDLAIVFVLFGGMPAWLFTVLKVMQAFALVDFTFNSLGIFRQPKRNDAWRTAELFGWLDRLLRVRIVTVLVIAVLACIVLV